MSATRKCIDEMMGPLAARPMEPSGGKGSTTVTPQYKKGNLYINVENMLDDMGDVIKTRAFTAENKKKMADIAESYRGKFEVEGYELPDAETVLGLIFKHKALLVKIVTDKGAVVESWDQFHQESKQNIEQMVKEITKLVKGHFDNFHVEQTWEDGYFYVLLYVEKEDAQKAQKAVEKADWHVRSVADSKNMQYKDFKVLTIGE
jgi:hypothetical protein